LSAGPQGNPLFPSGQGCCLHRRGHRYQPYRLERPWHYIVPVLVITPRAPRRPEARPPSTRRTRAFPLGRTDPRIRVDAPLKLLQLLRRGIRRGVKPRATTGPSAPSAPSATLAMTSAAKETLRWRDFRDFRDFGARLDATDHFRLSLADLEVPEASAARDQTGTVVPSAPQRPAARPTDHAVQDARQPDSSLTPRKRRSAIRLNRLA